MRAAHRCTSVEREKPIPSVAGLMREKGRQTNERNKGRRDVHICSSAINIFRINVYMCKYHICISLYTVWVYILMYIWLCTICVYVCSLHVYMCRYGGRACPATREVSVVTFIIGTEKPSQETLFFFAVSFLFSFYFPFIFRSSFYFFAIPSPSPSILFSIFSHGHRRRSLSFRERHCHARIIHGFLATRE